MLIGLTWFVLYMLSTMRVYILNQTGMWRLNIFLLKTKPAFFSILSDNILIVKDVKD